MSFKIVSFSVLAQEAEEEDEDGWDEEAKDDIFGEKTPQNVAEMPLNSSDDEKPVDPDP